MVLVKERKADTGEGGVIHTVASLCPLEDFCGCSQLRRCDMKGDSPAETHRVREKERGRKRRVERERERIINTMHQVPPEKEVSPVASASRISLLETGTELRPALAVRLG